MKKYFKLLVLVTMIFSFYAIHGCTDFPDEYSVDASVGEIWIQDKAELLEDGKTYTATVAVEFDIKENSFEKIQSAIVNINGGVFDVTQQLDAKIGGVAEVNCVLKTDQKVQINADLTISTHSFSKTEGMDPPSFENAVKLSTGDVENVTPCSAVLHAEANYPWLITNYNIFMMVSSEEFNIRPNEEVSEKWPVSGYGRQLLPCSVSINRNTYEYNIDCTAKGLNQNTMYYYQMVQLDSNNRVVSAGDTKSFKTTEATAKLTAGIESLSMRYCQNNIALQPGNLSNVFTSDWKLVGYVGKSPDALQSCCVIKLQGKTYTYNFLRGLDASTTYYYKYEFYVGDGYICSSDVQEFTTSTSTAVLNFESCNPLTNSAVINVSLKRGNTTTEMFDDDIAEVSIRYGESIDNMTLQQSQVVKSDCTIAFNLNELHDDRTYYCQALYSLNGRSVLGSSRVLEFKTLKSENTMSLGSLNIQTWGNNSSGSKQFSINARTGSILSFKYLMNPGDSWLSAQLTGSSNISLFSANSSRYDWKSDEVYYVFKESGSYTLTFKYSAGRYSSIEVPDISFIY